MGTNNTYNNKEKIGLLVEGGGMKCAYSAGVLDIFLDEGINFDYAIGISAGAANTASFLAGQRDRNKRFYTDHVSEDGYIGLKTLFKTGQFFGLQYIYRDLSNSDGADALDYEAMIANPTEAEFVATSSHGLVRYFNKNEIIKDDYRVIMASSALPVMCNPIEIDGEYYFDGGVCDSLPIDRALAMGCDKVVILSSKPEGYVMKPQGHRAVYSAGLRRKYPDIVTALNHRHEDYNDSLRKIKKLKQEGTVMVYNPSAELEISTTTTDPAVMQAFYDNGVEDAKNRMEELRRFMNL